jgi:hypothetical protein
MTADLVSVPVPGADDLMAAQFDGRQWAALRFMCDSLGVNYTTQLEKLRRRSWATVALRGTVAADGKTRDMAMIDSRSIPMWLATIDENRVKPEARPQLVAYQREAADALDAYFGSGGAINPRATDDQLAAIIARCQAQAGVLQALQGLIDPKHLELKARLLAARAMGEEPDIDTLDRPLLVDDFLASKGLNRTLVVAKRSGFGTRLRGLYISEYNEEPAKRLQDFGNGAIRECNAYTERHRHLFDQVWNRHYATKVADSALFAIDGGGA